MNKHLVSHKEQTSLDHHFRCLCDDVHAQTTFEEALEKKLFTNFFSRIFCFTFFFFSQEKKKLCSEAKSFFVWDIRFRFRLEFESK